MRNFKMLICGTILLSSISFGGIVGADTVFAKEVNYQKEILKLEPAISKNELESSVKSSSKKLHKSEKAIYKQIYNELKADIAQGNLEDKFESSKLHTLGASSGTKKLKNSATGDFYYTPSKTAGVNHGHVGLYYSKDSIVESVPKKGVYKIKVTNRRVENGAVIKSVKVSSSKKKSATNWALKQVGQKYSYNFATNRFTRRGGSTNCSKLIWAAFIEKAHIDLDKDGGAGVYPRDIRDDKKTKLVSKL